MYIYYYDKKIVLCPYIEILISNKWERIIDTHNDMSESQNNYAL